MIFNDGFYDKNVNNNELMISKENETLLPSKIVHDIIPCVKLSINESKKINNLYYISDIHLDHKIIKRFPKRVSKRKIEKYIEEIVSGLYNSMGEESFIGKYILINGDVSHSFEICKLFFESLEKVFKYRVADIIVVLGNHETWEYNEFSKCVKQYRNFFKSLNITFLHNELLILERSCLYEKKILSEEQILNMSCDEIKELCLKSNLIILGGLGFSGYNPKFNANCGLYRDCVNDLEEDLSETFRFEKVYQKIKDSISDRKIVVMTHTPKENWSKDSYNNNWIYVNGHTHNNQYYKDDVKTLYADNQIGYYNRNVTFKKFDYESKYDIFRYYKDGIYTISREDYIIFNRGKGISLEFNREGYIIRMLKKDDLYCFFLQNEKDVLYLLDGGKMTKLKNNNLQYYYDSMYIYSKLLKDSTKEFNNILQEVSRYIKSIGGTGYIHGCIVDIDFLNHIYINPFDGKVSPYFALSMVEKYVYKDLGTLLQCHCPDIYLNYKNNVKNEIVISNNSQLTNYNFELFEDTNIYKPSKTMKSIQYLLNDNVIRIWNDEILEKYINKRIDLIANRITYSKNK